ncbi:C39 family peptidase [Paenibacillus sp. GCM10027628]|uniref:C39 family peptidase n=1 Tax=Paenibacillus sp. GCM10027628 TaxID=3273413 RepID=UPI0036358E24
MANRTFINNLNTQKYLQCGQSWSGSTTSCGGSMCSEGCYITSTAMVFKSFGDTVDPGTLLAALKPNAADCPINWTSAASKYGHTVGEQAPGTFDQLKAKLFDYIYNKNKPVVYCVSGSTTHAVVITGVNATIPVDPDTGAPETAYLTSSMFYVNDPGNNSNSTLDQVFSRYPSSVKIVAYNK